MSEKDLRHAFRDQVGRFGCNWPIESPIESGTPDNCCLLRFPGWPPERAVASWVEFKHAREWPKREGTPLKFKHFTKEQKLRLLEWHGNGGHCCVIVQVNREYFLVPPAHVRELQEQGATRERFMEMAAVYSFGKFPAGAFLRWLVRWS